MDIIEIYTDGGIRNRQTEHNVAIWACVLLYKNNYKEISGLLHDSTNNIAELSAPINGLKSLKRTDIPVMVYSDSQYVVYGIETWIYNWIEKNWKEGKKNPVKNKQYWQQLLEQKNRFDNINFSWVRGHDENKYNNRADEICNEEMDKYLGVK
jgi:ribonuclease HI